MKLLKTGFFSLIAAFAFAQTPAERELITKDYDMEASNALFEELSLRDSLNKAEAYRLADLNGWPLVYQREDGSEFHLTRVLESGDPIYIGPNNFAALLTIEADELYQGGSLGLDLSGAGIEVGVWDGGTARGTHEALTGRVSYGDAQDLDYHATHVTGTIIADDTETNAQGMAQAATVVSYDFAGDDPEMVSEAQNGMLISNHSYGVGVNSGTPKFIYGRYDSGSRAWDQIAFQHEFYTMVKSAGNDRFPVGLNSRDNGYDLLTSRSLSKNVLIVGAVNAVVNYSGPNSVVMSNFSSFGPPDDGRVKPDLVAKGVAQRSTIDAADDAYDTTQGTSMSSPSVAGGLALLQEYYNDLNNTFMKSATLRGLAIHTTKEAGDADGPDYRFGWGLLDVAEGARVIRDNGNSALIEELTLQNGSSYTNSFSANTNGDPITVSISWTDFGGQPNNTQVEDDFDPVLVNDLDVKVTGPDGTEYFPWVLDVDNFTSDATTGDNDVDNVEKIDIPNPMPGSYTITVTHEGNLFLNMQKYTLIVSGGEDQTFSTGDIKITDLSITPNPAEDIITLSFLNDNGVGNEISVGVFNMLGQEVKSESYAASANFTKQINISELTSGIYLVRVNNGAATTTKKLIVR